MAAAPLFWSEYIEKHFDRFLPFSLVKWMGMSPDKAKAHPAIGTFNKSALKTNLSPQGKIALAAIQASAPLVWFTITRVSLGSYPLGGGLTRTNRQKGFKKKPSEGGKKKAASIVQASLRFAESVSHKSVYTLTGTTKAMKYGPHDDRFQPWLINPQREE